MTGRGTLLLACLLVTAPFSLGQAEKPLLALDTGAHTDGVTGVVFTPDGQQLISVSRDKTIRFWDTSTGDMLRCLRLPIGHDQEGALWCVALAPDGRLLAVAGTGWQAGQSEIYLLQLPSGRIARILKGHTELVTRLRFSPDGKLLASSARDNTIRIWEPTTGKCAHVLEGHNFRIWDIAFAPDGKRLASGADDRTVRLWSVESGQNESILQHKDDTGPRGVRGVLWSPDGQTLLTCGADNYLQLMKLDGTVLRRHGPNILGHSLAFTKDPNKLLVSDVILDLQTGKESARFTEHKHGTFQSVISPDGTLVATGGWHGDELSLWKVADGSRVLHLSSRGRTNWSAGWSADGKTIAWGNTGKDSWVNTRYPLERTFLLGSLEPGPAPDASFTQAQGTRATLTITRVPKAEDRLALKEDAEVVRTFVLDKGSLPKNWTLIPGKELLAIGGIGKLYLFNLTTGKKVQELHGHAGDVRALAPSPDGRYLLSASSDQTLRVWLLNRSVPLVSLFFAGNDWIAWTPEGYYAASAGGERLMGWQVNNGLDKLATFHAAAQFRATLYRPDVIKRLLETGSVEKALELADKERGKTAALTQVAEILPPLVVITSPDQSPLEVSEQTVEVRSLARAVGNHPITAIRLLLDGRPYPGTEFVTNFDPPRVGEVRQSWTVKLAPGKHTLAVQAESRVSKAVSEAVEVSFLARGVERVPKDPEAKKLLLPNLYVLAVGVSAYPEKLKLNYAAKDATVLAKTCQEKSQRLFKEVTVKLLTDKDATRKNILQGLTWLRKQMTQNDVAIIFFAGHGAKDSDGSFYLLPVDVDTEDLLSTGVPGDQLKKTLAGMPGKFLVMLDACHAGAVDGEKRRAASALTDDLVRDLATDDYGVVVMCSSMGREFSLESPTVEHGYFTLAMVEGLSGKADYNQDGVVHLNELDLYVTNRVKELSEGRQHPVTARPTSIRSFPLTLQEKRAP